MCAILLGAKRESTIYPLHTMAHEHIIAEIWCNLSRKVMLRFQS